MVTQRCTRRRGITLLELMIGLVILSLVMGMIYFNIDSFTPKTRMEASCRDLGETLVFAREQAITSGRNVTVKIDLDKQRYYVVTQELNEQGKANEEKIESELKTLKTGVKISGVIAGEERLTKSGSVEISINPHGVSPGIIVQFTSDDYDLKYSIRVNPITGIVQMYDKHVENGFVKEGI